MALATKYCLTRSTYSNQLAQFISMDPTNAIFQRGSSDNIILHRRHMLCLRKTSSTQPAAIQIYNILIPIRPITNVHT